MERIVRARTVSGPILALLVVAAPICALFALEWRALDNFDVTTAQLLKQNSRHVAEELAGRIQRDFKSPAFNLLERVDHNAVRELRLGPIAATLESRRSESVLLDRFFLWSDAGPAHGTDAMFFFDMRDGERSKVAPVTARGEPLPADGFRRDPALARALLARGQEFAAIHANFALAEIHDGSRPYEVVYHLLYDVPERRVLLSILGFMIDETKLCEEYFPGVVASREVAERQFAAFSPLLVSIVDDRGREVYRSGRSLLNAFEDEVPFPYLFYDVDIVESLAPFRPTVRYWRVRTAYDAGSIAGIVRHRTETQRLLWSGVALLTAVGLTLTARAAIREVRVADMKSEFVASVSHELQTPLAKIQLFADTVRAGRAKSPEKLQEYAEIISTQARKLSREIGGILAFGKIEAGRQQYEIEEIDVRAVLSSALASFERELDQNGFAVTLHTPASEVPVNANAQSLQRVFENLISNAIKFSDVRHELAITLRVADGQVHVAFRDRGIGVPRREQRKIFRKFYRASHTMAKPVAGSGLGLAIVQHIVEAHGGRVGVDSVRGDGSTFTVVLPAFTDAERSRPS